MYLQLKPLSFQESKSSAGTGTDGLGDQMGWGGEEIIHKKLRQKCGNSLKSNLTGRIVVEANSLVVKEVNNLAVE